MTHIEFECPFCSRPMKVPASAAGKSGKCKSCKNTVIVPKRKTEPNPASTERKPATSNAKRRIFLPLLAASVVAVAGSVYFYWTGTTTELHSEENDETMVFRTDTKSIRTGLITHTRILVLSKSQPITSATAEGDLDETGNRHGKWKFGDELSFITNRWFWHGRECTEAEFNSQTDE